MLEKGDLGLTARAWESAKIYNGSNLIRHFDGIVNTDSVQTLGNFAKTRGMETWGMDPDSKVDDRLLKYHITEVTPTKNQSELENPSQFYLITDEYGHDIGTYEISDKGPVFRLSPKIREANEKIINSFPEEQQEILREKYRTDNMEDLVEKLAKGEEVALASKEQARDDIEEDYEKRGLSVGDGTTNEDQEEEKAISAIPSDMRSEVINQCREKGISIKEVLVVDCAECLSDEINNERVGLRKNGGPVILVQARSGDASLQDDVYAFQDGRELQNANEDNDRIVNLMEQHRGEGAVVELEDTEKERVMRHIEEVVAEAEEKIANIMANSDSFESVADRDRAIMKEREDLVGEIKSIIDYHDYEPDKEVENILQTSEKEAEAPYSVVIDDAKKDLGAVATGVGTIAALGAGAAGLGIVAAGVAGAALSKKEENEQEEHKEEHNDGERTIYDGHEPGQFPGMNH